MKTEWNSAIRPVPVIFPEIPCGRDAATRLVVCDRVGLDKLTVMRLDANSEMVLEPKVLDGIKRPSDLIPYLFKMAKLANASGEAGPGKGIGEGLDSFTLPATEAALAKGMKETQVMDRSDLGSFAAMEHIGADGRNKLTGDRLLIDGKGWVE